MGAGGVSQSLDRGLSIFEMIANSENGLTLQQISHKLLISPSTLHPLIKSLIARGYLGKAEKPRRYVSGPALGKLSVLQWRNEMFTRAAEKMLELSGKIPDAVISLAQYNGEAVVQKLRLSPERPGVVEKNQERVMNPYSTASGQLFMAYMTVDELEQLMERFPFHIHGHSMWWHVPPMIREFKFIRHYSFVEVHPKGGTYYAAAGPVWGPGEVLEAAFGVSCPLKKFTKRKRERYARLVCKASEQLSEPGVGSKRMIPKDFIYRVERAKVWLRRLR